MEIAILGGTGDVGRGLALRWGRDADHRIVVGSRDADRATEAAADYREVLAGRGVAADLGGAPNPRAAEGADVVVVSVPPYYVDDTVAAVADRLVDGAILVTPAVGLESDETGVHHRPPDVGSVTALVADGAPPGIPVVGAFHNLAAGRLANLDATLGIDTVVVGDDPAARETVADLAEDIDGLRALDAGRLANAPEVESLTALQITLARCNEGLHDVGVRFE